MPTSYQAPRRSDAKTTRTVSQSETTNMRAATAVVQNILDAKGGDVFDIRPDQTLHDAVEVLREKRIGALLVRDGAGALVGILSERDIVRKLADAPGQTLPKQVSDVMTSRVESSGTDETLVSVLRRMTDGRFRHMPVVEDGELKGMITIGDVVNFRLAALEHEALQLKQLIVG